MKFANEYLDGYEISARKRFSSHTFAELTDMFNDEQFAYLVKNITHSGISFFTDDF